MLGVQMAGTAEAPAHGFAQLSGHDIAHPDAPTPFSIRRLAPDRATPLKAARSVLLLLYYSQA